MEENENDSAVTRAGLPLKKDVLIRAGFPLKGGAGSGNFDHAGNPPNVGGSGEGGGEKQTEPNAYKDYSDAEKAASNYFTDIPDAQRITDYTKSEYRNINQMERQGKNGRLKTSTGFVRVQSEEDKNNVARISEMLKDAPKYEGTSYRAVDGFNNRSVNKTFGGLQVGDTFTDKGFGSTSSDNEIFTDMAFRGVGKSNYKIETEGKSGVAIASVSGKPSEHEILFDKNSTFEVKSHEIMADDSHYIKAVEV